MILELNKWEKARIIKNHKEYSAIYFNSPNKVFFVDFVHRILIHTLVEDSSPIEVS